MLENIETSEKIMEKRAIPATGEDWICKYCGNEMEHPGEKLVRDEMEITPAKVV